MIQLLRRLMPDYWSHKRNRESEAFRYEARKGLLKNAWKLRQTGGKFRHSIKMDELIARLKSESKKHSFLSSLYFAGSFVDHPYFMENDKIAIGISVLPEDSKKTQLSKRHPHQTEIIIVLQGSINVFEQMDTKTMKFLLTENEHHIIEKNKCHWIAINENSENAAFIFIKTNPAAQPREEHCG